MLKVVKSNYFNKVSHFKKIFNTQDSDYNHLSQSAYYKYLNRLPKQFYKKEYHRMQQQALKHNDNILYKKSQLKLKSLQKPIVNLHHWDNMIKAEPNYEPAFLHLIISHNKPVSEQGAYLKFHENLVKDSFKLPSNYFHSYGVYHDDTFHEHMHLVLYQDKKFYQQKKINHQNVKYYWNKKWLKQLKSQLNYEFVYDLQPQINHEAVLQKLVKVIQSYDNNLTAKKRFTINLLLKFLKVDKNSLLSQDLLSLQRLLYKCRNMSANVKDLDNLVVVNQKLKLKRVKQLDKAYLKIIHDLKASSDIKKLKTNKQQDFDLEK